MHRLHNLIVSFSLLLAPLAVPSNQPRRDPGQAGTDPAAILAAMTPAERVGQLFLVSFYGPSVNENSDIHRLIDEYHVGGVVITAANDNITDPQNAPAQLLELTNTLQTVAAGASNRLRPLPGAPATSVPAPYVPLFIAINHEGNGYPYTEIRSGVTELPSPMAIGATWDSSHAESMGRIVGTELSALGVNFLLGPSLDVLEQPRPDGVDLGSRVFGGNPYWVGVMGQAYIRGVKFGSDGRVATIAKHFPGHGGAERRPEVQVPTVRKSFEQLQNFDLVPFFAVLGGASSDTTADGILSGHIRFEGFQGNIRQVTPPASLDAQALGQLLALPAVEAWRAAGGVTVSDSLGVRAVKRFFDPALQSFQGRRIAGQAFNAGNDILLVSEFGLNPRVDQTSNIIDTMVYFRQLYEADPGFAARVDAAVLRILGLKLRLYAGEFNPQDAIQPQAGLSVLGRDQEDVVSVAQNAAALISPTRDELAARAPEPPTPSQRIVFFTDVRLGQQCSTCLRYPLLDKRQLEQAVLQLYGPNGSGQTRANNLASFSFEELAEYLENQTPASVDVGTATPQPAPVALALAQADWIVFSMLNVTSAVPASRVVSTFLSQHPEIVRAKRVIVIAFDAPYYLDTTELSNLTAYYAVYSRAPAFVTTAARLLFRDLAPTGAPAVSVASVGYDLSEVARPDPNARIELYWEKLNTAGEGTPEPTGLQLGDTITVTTGILRDPNGHQVPDFTPVRFRVYYSEEGLADFFESPTRNGVASVTLLLNRPGPMEIDASSDPATLSDRFTINVQQDSVFSVTEIVPTPAPTDTPQPTETSVPPTATATPTEPAPTTTMPERPGRVNWRGFFVMCLGLAAVLFGGYRLGSNGRAQPRQGMRVALAGAIGMLAGYNYYALALPGTGLAQAALSSMAAPIWAIAGGLIGLGLGWLWFVLRRRPATGS
jgi:beta-N-acetylhexosaminidase